MLGHRRLCDLPVNALPRRGHVTDGLGADRAAVPACAQLSEARAVNSVAAEHGLHSATAVEEEFSADWTIRGKNVFAAVVVRLCHLRPAHAALIAVNEVFCASHSAQPTSVTVKLSRDNDEYIVLNE